VVQAEFAAIEQNKSIDPLFGVVVDLLFCLLSNVAWNDALQPSE